MQPAPCLLVQTESCISGNPTSLLVRHGTPALLLALTLLPAAPLCCFDLKALRLLPGPCRSA